MTNGSMKLELADGAERDIEAVQGQPWVTLILVSRVNVDALGPLYVIPGPIV